jgi:hypothetical protein
MKLLQSSKVSIPIIYLVESNEDFLSLPMGIPYIRGAKKDYGDLVRLLEFEILLKSALATGFPFNWKQILHDNGFGKDISSEARASGVYKHTEESEELVGECIADYIESTMYIVDVEYLKNLKILPTWFTDIETAVKENIMNTILYNPSLYNKKLDLCSGSVELTTPEKNLIIIDISGSIPKAISKAVLLLAKTMASQFYADLLITGSKSTLYDYTEMDKLDVTKIYDENEMDNDQVHFLKLLSVYRKYNTAIVFGDEDYPGYKWRNTYNTGTRDISIEEGKKLNKWEVSRLYSFHKNNPSSIAAYGRWFSTEDVTHMKNWVKYLN